MRNLIIFAFFVFALVATQYAKAQTADEVVDKYINALGGKDKLSTLKTVKMEGNLSMQGMDIALTITKKHLVGYRLDISLMGTENYQIITPDKGWVFMPVQGQAAPEEMPEEMFKSGQTQLDIQSALLNYKDKGTTVEMAGKETVDTKECYKLNITFKNGIKTTYYITTQDNRLYKSVSKMTVNGETADVYNIFTDYKQNAEGFWFAYTSTNMRGTTTYDKIETNVAVDDNIFKN